MAKRTASEIEAHIGRRIRARRMQLGISQETLGEKIGLTFQQVQKYEKGTNGTRGSRLVAIAEVLQVTPAYFFEGIAGGKIDTVVDAGAQFLTLPYSNDLTTAFAAMNNEQRKALVNVAIAMLPTALQAKAA